MEFLYSIFNLLLFLVMLGVLVTIHELGHFLVAKMFKVYVFEFAIGFGPKVFRKKKGETYYSLRALPLGGYVSMLGEEGAVPEEHADIEIPKERSLIGINRGKRALIMSAGIIMNLVLGYVIFLFSNGTLKQTQLTSQLKLTESSSLGALGVNDDDYFIFDEVNVASYKFQHFGVGTYSEAGRDDTEVYVLFQPTSFKDLTFAGKNISLLPTNTTTLSNDMYVSDFKAGGSLVFDATFVPKDIWEAMRGDEEAMENFDKTPYTHSLTLGTVNVKADEYTLGALGLALTSYQYRNNFVQTFKAANRDFVASVTAVATGLKSLFTQGLTNVSGPIGIFNMSASTLQNQGLGSFLFLWGLISINLALFNLLPFPPLDGWHLLVVIVESITRQEINPKFKNIASMIGAGLIILLTIAILAKDVISIFGVML